MESEKRDEEIFTKVVSKMSETIKSNTQKVSVDDRSCFSEGNEAEFLCGGGEKYVVTGNKDAMKRGGSQGKGVLMTPAVERDQRDVEHIVVDVDVLIKEEQQGVCVSGDELTTEEERRRKALPQQILKGCATFNAERPHSCGQCEKTFKQKITLLNHMLTHTGERPFSCDQCFKTFRQKTTLTKHMLTHTGEKPYSCDQCSQTFGRKGTLKRHMQTHTGVSPCHREQSDFVHKVVSLNCANSEEGELRPGSGEKSDANVRTVLGMGEEERELYSTEQRTAVGEDQQSRIVGLCAQVSHQTNETVLQSHVSTSTGEKQYHCGQCVKSFSTNSHLKRHLKIHSGPRSCRKCAKIFAHPSELKIHIKTHLADRPHVCGQCDKAFTKNAHLKEHIKTHTGERPYCCELCEKAFALKRDLKRHMMTHTGDKPHACEQCDKAFTTKQDLKRHMMTHTEGMLFCDQCSKSFTHLSNYKSHMMTHM